MKHFATALTLLAGTEAIRTRAEGNKLSSGGFSSNDVCSRFDERSSNSAFKTLQDHLRIHCNARSAGENESTQAQAEWRTTLKEGIEKNDLPAIACTIRSVLNRLEKDCQNSVTNDHSAILAVQSSVLNTPLHEDAFQYADPPLAYALETIIEQRENAILPPTLWLIAAGADGSQKLKSEVPYLELAKAADDALSSELSHVILEALIFGQTGGYNADGTVQKLSNPKALLEDAKSRLKELALEESVLFYKLVQAAKYKLNFATRSSALQDASRYLVESVLPARCSAAKELSKVNPNSGLAEYGLRLQLATEVPDDQASVEQVSCTLLTLGKSIDPRTGEFVHASQLNFQEPKTRDTPLHKVARLIANAKSTRTQKRGTIIMAMLLSAGASATLVNRDGLTPLEVLFRAAPKTKSKRATPGSSSVDSFVQLLEGAAASKKASSLKKKSHIKKHSAFIEEHAKIDAGDKAILLELLNSHALDKATFTQLQAAAQDLELFNEEDLAYEQSDSDDEDGDDVGGDRTQINLAAGFLLAYGGNFSSGNSMRGVVNYEKLGTSQAQILATLDAMEKHYLRSDSTLERDLLMQALPELLKASETVPGVSLNKAQESSEPAFEPNQDDRYMIDESEQEERQEEVENALEEQQEAQREIQQQAEQEAEYSEEE